MALPEKNMKTKELEEIDCVNRFLPFFNKENSSTFLVTQKSDSNGEQNGIDVLAYNNKNSCLNIQVTFADYGRVGQFKKHISEHKIGNLEDIPHTGFRDRHDVKIIDTFLLSIKNKITKYRKRKLNISDIVLLLDDYIGQIPKSTFEKRFVDKKNDELDKNFKEIWYVGKDYAYKIF